MNTHTAKEVANEDLAQVLSLVEAGDTITESFIDLLREVGRRLTLPLAPLEERLEELRPELLKRGVRSWNIDGLFGRIKEADLNEKTDRIRHYFSNTSPKPGILVWSDHVDVSFSLGMEDDENINTLQKAEAFCEKLSIPRTPWTKGVHLDNDENPYTRYSRTKRADFCGIPCEFSVSFKRPGIRSKKCRVETQTTRKVVCSI